MLKFVNAMGDACPIPAVKTKNAIKELNGEEGIVETLVDNEIAVQNLTKMAQQKHYGVRSEKLDDEQYRVIMTIGENKRKAENLTGENENSLANDWADSKTGEFLDENMNEADKMPMCVPKRQEKHTVVVISSPYMGNGDDELGAALMKGFIYALSQQDELPTTILFYNGGAALTCSEAPVIEDLKSLEAQGVEILTCGTCLNHYGLTEQLQVGGVTNMYMIAEKMMQADVIVKP